jgi:hypothetical protein
MNGRSLRILALLIALTDIGLIYWYLLESNAGYDAFDHVLGRDFLNIYFAGHLIGTGRSEILFDLHAYDDALLSWIGHVYAPHNWSYPPSIFPIALGLSKLPYNMALLIWHAVGIVLLILAMRAVDLSKSWQAAILFSPPATANLLAGQNGFYSAALLVLALVCSHAGRKWPAALSWAALTLKPHLGLMALPLLLKAKRYGVILLTGLVTLLMIAVTGILFGFENWYRFLTDTAAIQRLVMESLGGLGVLVMPTWFIQARIFNFPMPWCYGLQAVMALPAIWFLWRSLPSEKSDVRDWLTWSVLGLYCLLSYYFIYDLVAFAVMLALWAREPEKLFDLPYAVLARGCWLLFWLLAYLTALIVQYRHIHIAPLFMLWLLWRYSRHVHSRSETSAVTDAPAFPATRPEQEPA